ncbi:MAG: hypothetical protein WCO84_03105 [bacterium]
MRFNAEKMGGAMRENSSVSGEKQELENKKEAERIEAESKNELKRFGIEEIKENLELVQSYMKTLQIKDKEIADNLNNPEELKKVLKNRLAELNKDIKTENEKIALENEKNKKEGKKPNKTKDELKTISVAHSEGITVWDHVKTGLNNIEEMDIPSDEKKKMKILFLYHDLGKNIVTNYDANKKGTEEESKKGKIIKTMRGHAEVYKKDSTEETYDVGKKVKEGFIANGIDKDEVKIFMKVVNAHMKDANDFKNLEITKEEVEDKSKESLKNIKDKQNKRENIFKYIDKLATSDEERIKIVSSLFKILDVDGNATGHLELIGDELKQSKNEKKTSINFDEVWSVYSGIKEEKRKEAEKKEAYDVKIKDIFPEGLNEYRSKMGITEGKKIGMVNKLIDGIVNNNPNANREFVDIEVKKALEGMK